MDAKRVSETDLQREIMLALSGDGHFVERIQSGLYYTKDGREVRIGYKGRSDVSGARAADARAFFLEIKQTDSKKITIAARKEALLKLQRLYPPDELAMAEHWMCIGATEDQAKFLLAMRKRGAIGEVVRSVADARRSLL